MIRASKRPLIIAGGGVIYSEATDALRQLVDATGIPVGETQAGKGSLPFDHPARWAASAPPARWPPTASPAQADLVIGVGTRYSDFTTASKTAFQDADVRFVNVNVAEADAPQARRPGADRRRARDPRGAGGAPARAGPSTPEYRQLCAKLHAEWDQEVSRLYHLGHAGLPAQSEVIGAVNELSAPRDVVVCAAGSMPGDLHKLWRTRDPKGYHVEYGYSTMGYEIAGGLGVKLADPEREVYVMVGDGSYLMMAQEIVTSIQERTQAHGRAGRQRRLRVDRRPVAIQGHGRVWHALSLSHATARSVTIRRTANGEALPVDLALNARASARMSSARATSRSCATRWLRRRTIDRTVVIHVPVDRYEGVPSYESWWEVPVAEVSESGDGQKAREEHERGMARRRWHL